MMYLFKMYDFLSRVTFSGLRSECFVHAYMRVCPMGVVKVMIMYKG